MNLINRINAANPDPKVREVAQQIVSSLRNGDNTTLDVSREVFEEIARITGKDVNTTWSWKWIAFFSDDEETRVDIQYRDYLGDIAEPLKTEKQ